MSLCISACHQIYAPGRGNYTANPCAVPSAPPQKGLPILGRGCREMGLAAGWDPGDCSSFIHGGLHLMKCHSCQPFKIPPRIHRSFGFSSSFSSSVFSLSLPLFPSLCLSNISPPLSLFVSFYLSAFVFFSLSPPSLPSCVAHPSVLYSPSTISSNAGMISCVEQSRVKSLVPQKGER